MEFPKITMEGKVVIITGGGKGLGRVASLAFAAAGAAVVVASRTLENCEKVAQEIRDFGKCGFALKVDVTRSPDVTRLVETVEDEFGKIDVLFNNAGITMTSYCLDHSEQDWRNIIDTNLTGTFLCSKAVAKLMVRQRWGRIINMGSILSNYGMATRTAYCSSKAAVAHFTKALAIELGPYGITVNAIAPNVIITDLNREAIKKTPNLYNNILARTPVGRFGKEEDIAGVLVFLASPAAEYITGQTIYIDGGYTAG
jgi:NAD(P)-dependent dehydrogenase (short-subunit alcohol dehydrogenase family)